MKANVIKVAGTAMLPVFEEAAFATKAGRPSFKRIKSSIEISTKRSKHAKDSAH